MGCREQQFGQRKETATIADSCTQVKAEDVRSMRNGSNPFASTFKFITKYP
jgi:hypothetical protein